MGVVMTLPPYGSRLAKLLKTGKKPRNDIFCFCGYNAWRKAKALTRSQYVLCLPPGANPIEYQWPVRECDVLVFDTGGCELRDIEHLAYCLLCAEAAIVRAVLCNQQVIYRRDMA